MLILVPKKVDSFMAYTFDGQNMEITGINHEIQLNNSWSLKAAMKYSF